jgi:flagellar assembly factor FliW
LHVCRLTLCLFTPVIMLEINVGFVYFLLIKKLSTDFVYVSLSDLSSKFHAVRIIVINPKEVFKTYYLILASTMLLSLSIG